MFGFEGEGILDDGRPSKEPEKEGAVESLVRTVRENPGGRPAHIAYGRVAGAGTRPPAVRNAVAAPPRR
jgi:hypothetical protein